MSLQRNFSFDDCKTVTAMYKKLSDNYYNVNPMTFNPQEFLDKINLISNTYDPNDADFCYQIAFLYFLYSHYENLYDNMNIPLFSLIKLDKNNLDRIILLIGHKFLYPDYFDDNLDELIFTLLNLFNVEMRISTLAETFTENMDFAIYYFMRNYYNTHLYSDKCKELILNVIDFMIPNKEDISYFMSLIFFFYDFEFTEEFLIEIVKKADKYDINILPYFYDFKRDNNSIISFDKNTIIEKLKLNGINRYNNVKRFAKRKCGLFNIIPPYIENTKQYLNYSYYINPKQSIKRHKIINQESNEIIKINYNFPLINYNVTFRDNIIIGICIAFNFTILDIFNFGKLNISNKDKYYNETTFLLIKKMISKYI